MDKHLDAKITAFLEANRERIFADIDRMLRINSATGEPVEGAPLGKGINDALNEMLGIYAAHGLKTRNIDGMVGEAVWGEGKQSLGIIAHVDIVPVGEGWTKPPLALTVKDGMMFGRGVMDDKGPAVASLWALLAALDAGADISKRIVFLVGGDEESGSRCMRRYLQTEQPPDMAFTPDGSFPVIFCEKTLCRGTLAAKLPAGSALKAISGGTRTNVVPGDATALLAVRPAGPMPDGLTSIETEVGWALKAIGTAAHASMPEKGDNAIIKLLAALKILLPPGDPALPAITGLYDCCAPIDGSGFGIACADEVSGRLTFNLGVIDAADGRLTALFDVRHPVFADVDRNLHDRLPAAAIAAGWEASGIAVSQGFCQPKDQLLVKTLLDTYNEINESHDEPLAIGGGTYARYFPNTVAYGILFSDDPETAHMADERISVESFMKATRIYANAIAELGK